MGIQTKLTAPVLIAFVFFTSVIHFYWGPTQYAEAKATISKRLHRELSTLDISLTEYLLENNYAALYAALQERDKASKGKWRHLTLYDDNQKRIYPLFLDESEIEHADEYIPYTHPILLEGNQLGVIQLYVDWSDEYETAQHRIYELELYFLSTVLVFIFFSIAWQYLIIIKPIKYLQRAVNFMMNGDFFAPLPVISHDEIGQLTQGFDRMRQTITDSQQQLKQANEEIQKAFEEVASMNNELHNEIGERKKIQDRLNRIATHDELTTLPNRYLLKQEAIKALSAASRFKHNVGIMFIDLDEFKAVNDNHSHEIGDVVLVEISLRISDEVRNIDTVGRVGGDEFVIILPDCNSPSNLKDIARRIIDKIKLPVECIKISEIVSASIGISVFPDNGNDFDTLLSKADSAMYQAKKLGKNQFCLCTEDNPYTIKS
jgi:diguanylate cyclase (GGDEF)-like protein